LRVVDGLMDTLFRTVSNFIIGYSFVAEDHYVKTNILLDDSNESVCVSLVETKAVKHFRVLRSSSTKTH
jgi:hypothetical protein